MPIHALLALIHEAKQQDGTIVSMLYATVGREFRNKSTTQRLDFYKQSMQALETLSSAMRLD